jgi:hypothetical protein
MPPGRALAGGPDASMLNASSLVMLHCANSYVAAAAAFAGHHHSYQRSCPVHRQECRNDSHGRPAATVHVVHGHGGAGLYEDGFAQRPRWAAFEERTQHGYIRLHADGGRLHLEAVSSKGVRGGAGRGGRVAVRCGEHSGAPLHGDKGVPMHEDNGAWSEAPPSVPGAL